MESEGVLGLQLRAIELGRPVDSLLDAACARESCRTCRSADRSHRGSFATGSTRAWRDAAAATGRGDGPPTRCAPELPTSEFHRPLRSTARHAANPATSDPIATGPGSPATRPSSCDLPYFLMRLFRTHPGSTLEPVIEFSRNLHLRALGARYPNSTHHLDDWPKHVGPPTTWLEQGRTDCSLVRAVTARKLETLKRKTSSHASVQARLLGSHLRQLRY